MGRNNEVESIVRKVRMRRGTDDNGKACYYFYIVFENKKYVIKKDNYEIKDAYNIFSDSEGEYILIYIYDGKKVHHNCKVYLKF